MTPEAADYLRMAREALADAKTIEAASLHRVATREAYVAAFHAAEAYIFERGQRTAKTHRGLRTLFSQMAKNDPGIPSHFPGFLADAYELKSISDYGIDPTRAISAEEATSTIATAEHLIATIEELLR